ncbi:MAG TPA: hypothetical protein VFZ34_20070, partial [Blastocatellia bacterium]|nr:hypothetical protein [Blastocatellia bacterium]
QTVMTIITLLALTNLCWPQVTLRDYQEESAARKRTLRLRFEKSLSGFGVWEGTVSGDIRGKLKTVMQVFHNSGDIWRVEFDFIIDAGNESFTTRLNGLLNPKTGKVFMDGFVSTGYYEGAHVEEEGSLVDPATLKFTGSIKLIPRR